MSPAALRRLAAELDERGAHDLAIQARNRASEREAGEILPFENFICSFLIPPPGGGFHHSSIAAATHVQSSYHGNAFE